MAIGKLYGTDCAMMKHRNASMPKLTKAQKSLLEDIRVTPLRVFPDYKPAQRLVELGLAAWKEQKFGSSILYPVDQESHNGDD